MSLHRARFGRHDCELDQATTTLCSMDDRKLASIYQRELRRQRSSIHVDDVSNLFPVCDAGSSTLVANCYQRLVHSLSGHVRELICLGQMGILREGVVDPSQHRRTLNA